MSDRLRVLVLAYLISPVRGSEFAVAWNHVAAMRPYCDMTVLYGSAGAHMGDVDDFPQPNFVDRGAEGDVAFHFVPPPRLAKLLNALNRRGILTYSFYLAYRAWHRAVFREARRLCLDKRYDLIHYVGPIGYREPGFLWKLPLPFVWGPIGGATSFPWRFRAALPVQGRLRLIARTIGNALQLRLSRHIDRALRRTDFLLTATTENQEIFARLKGVGSTYLPENGIQGDITLNERKFPATPMRIIWVGSLEARKGLGLLLTAIGRLRDPGQVRIDVLGDGPLRDQLRKMATDLGIDSFVTWHGHVPRHHVIEQFDRAHLHAITGLNEANTTSIWEALARSVPILTLDHCGMHDIVQPAFGVAIPVSDIDGTTKAIGEALQRLIDTPAEVESMARNCAIECDRYRVVHRPPVLLDGYRTAIRRYRDRRARP